MEAPVIRMREFAAGLQLDLISPEGVITEAANLLSEFPSNGPLADLANAAPFREPVLSLLAKALRVEGSGLPSEREAGLLMAKDVGRRIINGQMSPSDGARTIWWKVVSRVPELEGELGHFVSLASEWEDDTAHRAEYEADIRRAAAELATE